MHVIAAKAVALKEALSPEFNVYQQQIVRNAQALAKGLMNRGFRLISEGTDNHLMLVDLRKSELTGKVAQETLDKARITVNRNAVPFDPRPPMVTSGLRVGTPALATRGLQVDDFHEVGRILATALTPAFDGARDELAERVTAVADRYPLYPDLPSGAPVASA